MVEAGALAGQNHLDLELSVAGQKCQADGGCFPVCLDATLFYTIHPNARAL